MADSDVRPTTHQGDLAKLPPALAPLIERPQWAVWRWTQSENGRWQKPPFMAMQPERHASTRDASTWSDYATALDVLRNGKADGISYVLTEDDPFAAIDLDHCRDIDTCSIGRVGTEFSRGRPRQLQRSDTVRRRLPHLGLGRWRHAEQKVHP